MNAPKQLELRPVAACHCGRPVHALGMCRACYAWWLKNGDEIVTRRLRETINKRLA